MPNRSTDELFQLIKSLEKAEKRNFKLFMKRNSAAEDLKTVQLFDALDRMENYDEASLLKKSPGLKKQQLSNIKASLYRQIMTSLRSLKDNSNIDMLLNEQMDFAKILYNKGLYLQSLKLLDKLKETAKKHSQFTYVLQTHFFEKKIESLHITRSMQDRADQLAAESKQVTGRLESISQLSNLSLQLYGWYIQHGHVRNARDRHAVERFFNESLPDNPQLLSDFYERLYLYQSYCWYAFILQDFLMYYRYCQKWVDLFSKEPAMIEIETAHYIKAIHNLMGAHFDLRNYEKLDGMIREVEKIYESRLIQQNINNKVQLFVYLMIAKINKHFVDGTFTEGLKLVPEILETVDEYRIYLDRHRILVFYYKIACLYFGSGDNEKTVDFLNKIIHLKADLRIDLQCYARLLHLIAHYELGNYDIIEHLIKSVYRFMSKMENLSAVEEAIFQFLRKSFNLNPDALRPAFERLHERLKKLEHSKEENRAFMYLDITSWLESKIQGGDVQKIIRDKFLQRQMRKAG